MRAKEALLDVQVIFLPLLNEESPRNLLILCPNHHKEFDYGQREILTHTEEEIIFVLNGVEHQIYIGLDLQK